MNSLVDRSWETFSELVEYDENINKLSFHSIFNKTPVKILENKIEKKSLKIRQVDIIDRKKTVNNGHVIKNEEVTLSSKKSFKRKILVIPKKIWDIKDVEERSTEIKNLKRRLEMEDELPSLKVHKKGLPGDKEPGAKL